MRWAGGAAAAFLRWPSCSRCVALQATPPPLLTPHPLTARHDRPAGRPGGARPAPATHPGPPEPAGPVRGVLLRPQKSQARRPAQRNCRLPPLPPPPLPTHPQPVPLAPPSALLMRGLRCVARPTNWPPRALGRALGCLPAGACRSQHFCPSRRRLHLSATCTALQTSAQQWRWEVPVVINSFGRDTDLAALRNWLRRHPGE